MYAGLGPWATLRHTRSSPAEGPPPYSQIHDQGIFLFDFHFLVFESSVLKIVSQGLLLIKHGCYINARFEFYLKIVIFVQ